LVIELHSSQPLPDTLNRIRRMMLDVDALSELTGPQARAVYRELEMIRDVLSLILDRADGK
jgi:hypothetical protein